MADDKTAPNAPCGTDIPANSLFRLVAGEWTSCGVAALVPARNDEIVSDAAQAAPTRHGAEVTLAGELDLPTDLFNTQGYWAYNGKIYRAYYLGHCTDPKGKRTVNFRIEETYDCDANGFSDKFARRWVGLDKLDNPTADEARQYRFERRYPAPRKFIAPGQQRTI